MANNIVQDGTPSDDSLNTDTNPQGDPTPQPSAEAHGDSPEDNSGSLNPNLQTGGDGSPSSEPPKPKEDDLSEKYARATGKMSQLESQVNDWLKFATSSEERYREALLYKGYSSDDVDQMVGNLKQQYPNMWNDGKPSEPTTEQKPESKDPTVDVEKIKAEIAKTGQEAYMKAKIADIENAAIDQFFGLYPELDPKGLQGKSQEEKQQVLKLAESIEDQARLLQKHQGVSYDQALIKAHSMLTGEEARTPETVQTAQQYQNNVSNVGVFSAPKASKASSGKGYSLSQAELEMAQQVGMTPEEYAKYKLED